MAARPLAQRRAPTETVLLASMVGRRQLAFYLESPDAGQQRIIRVVEETINAQGEMLTIPLERFLNLDQDAIIPLYTICGEPRTGYDIQVGYYDGNMPVIYPMRDRKEALRFQRFVTGHRTIEHFGGISSSIFFRGPLGVFWRDANLQGKGELQFWRSEETSKPPGVSLPAVEVSSLSPISPSGSSGSVKGGRRNSAVVMQSDQAKGREVIISTPPPKPLLVIFLGNYSRYIMMRMDAIDLECHRRTGENRLDLSQRQSSTFPASSLAVAKDCLSKWDLDAMARGSGHPGVEELKCTNLSISFPNASAMENFEKRLAFLRYQWHKAEVARRKVRRVMDTGKLPPTPDSRSRASTSSSTSLPIIPGLRLTTDEEWRQLEIEMQARELDGSPLASIFEMPVGVDESPPVAGASELPSPSQPRGEVLRAQFGETAGIDTAPTTMPQRGTGGSIINLAGDATRQPLPPERCGREPPPVAGRPTRPTRLRDGFIVVNRPP